MYCEDCSMYDHWTGFCYWFRNYPPPVEGAGCVRNNKKEQGMRKKRRVKYEVM